MKKIALSVTLSLFVCSLWAVPENKKLVSSSNVNYVNNKAPLLLKPYIKLPIGAIKADGWLKDQLERQANGLTGHLDKEYELVMGSRNGWLGGDGDVWERGPYWIDGLLPLAYILNDDALKSKVQPWIEWTLKSQKPNGYFGPDTDRPHESGLQRNNAADWWPKMVMLKVMQQYYSATGDQRVIPFMTNYFRYQLEELPKSPLGKWTFWGEQRGGDNLMIVYWLYNITGDKFLLDLGELIHKQTFNWTDVMSGGEYFPRLFSLHCVNVGQGVKEPIVYYQQSKNHKYIDATKKGFADMRQYLGFPTGLFGGDELLHGNNPTQGSELCTAVEMMLSLEEMTEITGDVQFADHLERVAFNALPTQATDNFDSRQYYQQVNQIELTNRLRNFRESHDGTDIVYGVLTGYPCCTSNMHQGWPKFTQNLWYATEDNGLAAMVYSPSEVTAKVANGVSVNIKEKTAYPFDEKIEFSLTIPDKKVKEVMFPLHLRVPAWCKEASIKVNGEPWGTLMGGNVAKVNRTWRSGDVVTLELPMDISVSRWYEASATIERGPLLYSLKIGEKWNKVTNTKEPVYGPWYYEVTATTPWNYGLIESSLRSNSIAESYIVVRKPNNEYPWNIENAPIEIKTKAKRIDHWQPYEGNTGPLPFSPNISKNGAEEITLIPYGCTTLRITEFPVVR